MRAVPRPISSLTHPHTLPQPQSQSRGPLFLPLPRRAKPKSPSTSPAKDPIAPLNGPYMAPPYIWPLYRAPMAPVWPLYGPYLAPIWPLCGP